MVNYHNVALEEERERQTEKQLSAKSVTLLSLIERVMSNLTGVELVQLQDNDQSSRALETTPYTRSARKGCVRRWSTSSPPAARGSAC